MDVKIVADSGSDILSLNNIAFESVPLTVNAGDKEFCDSAVANADEMIEYLKTYKGKSGSACPSTAAYMEAFGDFETVFCVTMTRALSGSYNSARVAAERYVEEHPDRRVFVIDSLSAGSGMGLIIKKLEELVLSGKTYEEICKEITEYQSRTELTFIIKSLNNLARNGRVKPAVAMMASVLGICLVCEASPEGTIEPIKKTRGEKGAIREAFANMKKQGYKGGKVLIDHCKGLGVAERLKETIKSEFSDAEIEINETRLLCSFYAEEGGVLIGYEK